MENHDARQGRSPGARPGPGPRSGPAAATPESLSEQRTACGRAYRAGPSQGHGPRSDLDRASCQWCEGERSRRVARATRAAGRRKREAPIRPRWKQAQSEIHGEAVVAHCWVGPAQRGRGATPARGGDLPWSMARRRGRLQRSEAEINLLTQYVRRQFDAANRARKYNFRVARPRSPTGLTGRPKESGRGQGQPADG